MTRWTAALVAPLLLGATKPILVPDVSQRQIEIAYSFTGADLLLFGVILHPGGRQPAWGDDSEIVVVVKGPSRSVVLREKRRVAGVWVNAAQVRFRSAPSYYALASSRPIETLLDLRTRAIYELGLDQLQLSPSDASPTDKAFDRGLVDLRRQLGLYVQDPDAVEITDRVLYRARVTIPPRVPVGRFTAETFLIKDGRVLAVASRTIDVRKSGFERLVARAADQWPLIYGLIAIALSILFGWTAGAAAKRIRSSGA